MFSCIWSRKMPIKNQVIEQTIRSVHSPDELTKENQVINQIRRANSPDELTKFALWLVNDRNNDSKQALFNKISRANQPQQPPPTLTNSPGSGVPQIPKKLPHPLTRQSGLTVSEDPRVVPDPENIEKVIQLLNDFVNRYENQYRNMPKNRPGQ